MTTLSTSFMGIEVPNPIIASASGLTSSVEKVQMLEKFGVGAVVLKSIFEEEILLEMEESMHQMVGRPYIFPETHDYMQENWKDDCVRQYLTLIREAKKACSIPIIASINCVSAQKWNYLSEQIQEAGADGLQLNLFFLPSEIGVDPNEMIYKTRSILKGITSRVSIPISVKIGPYCSNLASYIKEIEQMGAAGITLFNRTYNPDFDIHDFTYTNSAVLTSSDANAQTLRWIALMANRVACNLSASGGVHSAHDLIKQILAGAATVEIASTLYENGLKHISRMLDGLHGYMHDKGFDTITDFKGKMAADSSINREGWERTQFMKFFDSYASDHLF